MKAKLFQNKLSVKTSPLHGYGVYAEKEIQTDEIVEECYVLSSSEIYPDFRNYYFHGEGEYLIALGFGCIYNHAPEPNTMYTYHPDTQLLIFTAIKPIAKGEEILITYGDEWFSYRHAKVNFFSKVRRAYYRYKPMVVRTLIICGLYGLIVIAPHISIS